MTDLKEAMHIALDMEVAGHGFYMEKATTSTDPMAKKTFESLAHDELRHIERIKVIYAALEAGKSWTEAAYGQQTPIKFVDMFKVFAKTASKPPKGAVADSEDVKALKYARDIEAKAFKYYDAEAAKLNDGPAKSFLLALREEEIGHHDLIDSALRYLENPADYWSVTEGHMYDGG